MDAERLKTGSLLTSPWRVGFYAPAIFRPGRPHYTADLMRRGLVLLLLLTSLFWQTLTMAGQMVAFAQSEDLSHALLHWQDSAHHHHDDGFHPDDGDEGVQHVTLDDALQTAALLPSLPAAVDLGGPAVLVSLHQQGQPPPFLEGPRRPPRALA